METFSTMGSSFFFIPSSSLENYVHTQDDDDDDEIHRVESPFFLLTGSFQIDDAEMKKK